MPPKPSESQLVQREILNLVDSYVYWCGYNFFVPDWKYNWRCVAITLNFCFPFIVITSTIIDFWPDLMLICFATANAGYLCFCMHRFITWPLHAETVQRLFSMFDDMIADWEESSKEGQAVLVSLRLFKKLMKITYYYYIWIGIICVLPNILAYPFGYKVLPYQYHLPRLNYTTSPGFEWNLAFQTVETNLVMPILFANVYLILGLTFCVTMQSDILKLQIGSLDELAAETPAALKEQNEMLRRILQLHQTLDESIDDVEDVLHQQQFFDCFVVSFTIVMVVFVNSIQFYAAGIICIFLNIFMLFVTCFIGTVAEVKLEQLSETVNAISWYNLTPANQKVYILLILKTQSTERLTVGNLRPLNLNLFVQIMNKIYSYVMILVNMHHGE